MYMYTPKNRNTSFLVCLVSHVYIRANYLVLDNQFGISSLGNTIPPALHIPLLPVCSSLTRVEAPHLIVKLVPLRQFLPYAHSACKMPRKTVMHT